MITQEEIETLRKILAKFDDGAKEQKPTVEDKLIKSAVDGFDFKKVHDYMEWSNWTWFHGAERGTSVPTIDDLVRHSKYLLSHACELLDENDDQAFCASGGFEARAIKSAAGVGVEGLRLQFILDYSHATL